MCDDVPNTDDEAEEWGQPRPPHAMRTEPDSSRTPPEPPSATWREEGGKGRHSLLWVAVFGEECGANTDVDCLNP